MAQPELAQLSIEVNASNATEEDIDLMTRQLLSELRETDVESARLATRGEVPPGSKAGEALSIGAIVVSALPTVLPAVVSLVQAWAARGQGRTVKFRGQIGGRMIEFHGSAEELRNLIASLEARPFVRESSPAERGEDVDRNAREEVDRPDHPAKSKPTRASKIFISYRRADSADVAGRIYDRLASHFGESAIFKDVDSIPAGTDFKEYLEKAVGKCKIFLVVIGDKWLEAADALQNKRLQDPRDFVRIEIEAALNRNIRIIPLLVRGASMPAEEELPPSLQKLVYRNAIPIRPDPDFHRDMDRLIAALSDYVNKKS